MSRNNTSAPHILTTRWFVLALVLAVVLRLTYQEGMIAYGGSFHNGSDSGKYLAVATTIVDTGKFGRLNKEGDFTPELNRMPVYPYFLAGVFKVFGHGNLHAVVLLQIIVEICTIIGIALAAAAINQRLALPCAFFAAVLPNLLVHTAYVLTENLFLMFFTWGLCASLWALRAERPYQLLIAAGIFFSISLYTRPVMMFFPLFLYPTLVYALWAAKNTRNLHRLWLAAIPVLIMLTAATPRLVDTYKNYGHAVFTSQSGGHMLRWIYPCLRTPWSCSSHGLAWEENGPIVAQKLAALTKPEQMNPLNRDKIMRQMAIDRIRDLGILQITQGMIIGAIKNLVQTGFYETLTQFRQPATFFSAMPGVNLRERLSNFLNTNQDNTFMIFWFVAQLTLLASRLVQLVGLGHGLRNSSVRPFAIILTMTIVYFLAVNGPIGNPKYRIPTEPALIILFAMGFCTIADWARRRTSQGRQLPAIL